MMLHRLALVGVFVLALLAFTPRAQAVCERMDNTAEAAAVCAATLNSNIDNVDENEYKTPRLNFTLDISGTAQCKGPNALPNGTYAVCCDERTEANAVDSVRAPLCGASQERGAANSSCWTCEEEGGGKTTRCDGFDFKLGATDSILETAAQPLPGNTDASTTWTIPAELVPSPFMYNGESYTADGMLVICRSNNLACGAQTSCTNKTHPTIDNNGGSSGSNSNGPFIVNTTPGNGAHFIGMGGDRSFLNNGTVIETISEAFNFFVTYNQENKMTVPSFDKGSSMVRNAIFSSRNETTGPMTPHSMSVGLSSNKPYNWLEYVDVYQPCSKDNERGSQGSVSEVKVSEIMKRKDTKDLMDGSAILSGYLGTRIQGDKPVGIPSLDIATPIARVYELGPNGKPVLKESYKGFLYDCEMESSGKKAYKTLYDLINPPGESAVGELNFFKRITDTVKTDLQALIGAGTCASEPAVCLAKANQALGLGVEVTRIAGGAPWLNAAVQGGVEASNIPAGVNAQDFTEQKGWTNTINSNSQKSNRPYDERYGLVGQPVGVRANPEANGTQNIPVSGAAGTQLAIDTANCNLTNFSQTDYDASCAQLNNDLPSETSSWAQNGNGSAIATDFTVPSDSTPLMSAIIDAAQKYDVPQCVLEAVSYIEIGLNWTPTTQCVPNECSAAGPWAMTVGYDGTGSSACSQCNSSWVERNGCPDAWPNDWPQNPAHISACDVTESTRVATAKIKTDGGGLTNSRSIESQKRGIIYAGYRYYGSNKAINRLGGCSYGEFVYKHCVPNYTCIGEQSLGSSQP